MPFKLQKSGNKYFVIDENGKRYSAKPMARNRAMRQMRALYANVPEARKEAPQHTGAMLAFFLPPDLSAQLSSLIPGGEAPEELHVTLAYLGDTVMDNLDKAAILTAVGQFASSHPTITGKLNGYGRFTGEDDGSPVYVNFDAPDLPNFRQVLTQILDKHGIAYACNHGYTPHITLAYLAPDAPTPDLSIPPEYLTFDTVWLAWGPERIPFKLQTAPAALNSVKEGIAATVKEWAEKHLTYPQKRRTLKERRLGFTVYKQADGTLRWVAFSSNGYRDRDGEIVSTKALIDDVERADHDGDYGPLRWWHVKGLDIGDCDFNMMHGRILIESGTFRSPEIGEVVRKEAPSLEISIGFVHPPTEPDKAGVFHHIRRFERSLVPKGRVSNRFTKLIVEKE